MTIVYPEKHGRKLLIVALIDNLLKGASGQAIQNVCHQYHRFGIVSGDGLINILSPFSNVGMLPVALLNSMGV
jgi:N-acetyl-gamma-glutamylphosphate reductase